MALRAEAGGVALERVDRARSAAIVWAIAAR
jgi:hypothetical protein